jgi:pimeloyl-ACP methyl ester carboxylesterase
MKHPNLPSHVARGDITDEGAGDAVVLLHSSMASKAQWRSLGERLRGRRRVIAIDLLGYGQAPMPPALAGFGLAEEIARLDALLATRLAPGERFHLVGHSYGGGVALRWARRSPARVRSLTLFEPTSFHLLPRGTEALHSVRQTAAAVAQAVRGGDTMGGTARFIDFWNGPGSFDRLDTPRQQAFARLLPKTRLDFKALFGNPLTLPALRKLAMPVLLMGGRHSPACVHAVLAALAQTLPNGELAWVDAGHMAPLTHAALVDPLIATFLDRTDAPSGVGERLAARCVPARFSASLHPTGIP